MPIKVNLDNVVFQGRALEFIETYNFPKDLLVDVVRRPTKREMDPHNREVGYPVVRCRRGDITVVLGLRDPNEPAILFVYLHTPEDNQHAMGSKSPGGTGSKMPTSTTQLKGWLYSQGCRVQMNGRGHFNVYYKDRLLGGIAATGNTDSVKNDFAFMRRRIAAEKARESLQADMEKK